MSTHYTLISSVRSREIEAWGIVMQIKLQGAWAAGVVACRQCLRRREWWWIEAWWWCYVLCGGWGDVVAHNFVVVIEGDMVKHKAEELMDKVVVVSVSCDQGVTELMDKVVFHWQRLLGDNFLLLLFFGSRLSFIVLFPKLG